MPANRQNSSSYSIDGLQFSAPRIQPGLYVVATPIGNLTDITLRALQVLSAADVTYCEDTRVSARLMARYDIKTPLKPYHDHNGAKQRPLIITDLENGATIALISDAGTPLVSDPGYKLVRQCIDNALPVDMIPGANAPLTALALSGLPSDQFQFCGFLPARQTARLTQLNALASSVSTLIFLESAKRLTAVVKDLNTAMPGCQVAVCRELTKLHQEIIRGSGNEVAEQLAGRPTLKGEVTLVVAPPEPQAFVLEDTEVKKALRDALEDQPVAKAARQVSKHYGLKKSAVYALAVQLKTKQASS